MKTLGKISVFPRLPDAIQRLEPLAANLWWAWHPDAQDLYASIDPDLWVRVNQNPTRFLHSVKQQLLVDAAEDPDYIERYDGVMQAFDDYMSEDADTWYRRNHPDRLDQKIAYFSAEFGLHEALPIYSGGLGILSGDHCKEASDMGLPFVGVGFLYPQGYFTQRVNADGRQEASYEKIDFSEVPAKPALDGRGEPIMIHVDLPGRTVYAKVWQIQVGRIPLYLMDTDVERNAPQDRELSARLYGGDNEVRISQEFVLGIGGVRALRALGYSPDVWHMNEGHSAFLNLERIRELVQSGLTFDSAVEVVRASSVFTTHTPVAAGHDAFAFELVEKFFWQYWGQLGIDRERFLRLASHDQGWGAQFSMTVLAFSLSAYHNGVSELHGHVSRTMWRELWPGTPVGQVPIGHVTNGVHAATWLAPELQELYGRVLGSGWREEIDDPQIWEQIHKVASDELWSVHQERKEKMIDFVRRRITTQLLRQGEGPERIGRAENALDPNALTLGFARRFATYKRATLIFRDLDRLKRILCDPERPVQLVFAGKAHPQDEEGKALIQTIYQLSQEPGLEGRIIFVENYDMNIARHLVAGVDVWLNNPRRPYEASGTSGQKAAMSGVPNASILDGWWREGYNGENGWAIGEEREYKDQETQDEADALSLYTLLENEIVPLFYDRDDAGLPQGWIEKMKNSIESCAPTYSMRRMLVDYTRLYYIPAGHSGDAYAADSYALAQQMAEWKQRVRQNWSSVRIEAHGETPKQARVGEPIQMGARIWSGSLDADDVQVEIVLGQSGGAEPFNRAVSIPMSTQADQNHGGAIFSGSLSPDDSGQLSVGIRVRPSNPHLINPYELGLNHWA